MSEAGPKFYIQWNLVNWITIVMMVFAGMLLMGFVASALRQYAASSQAAGASDD